MKDADSLSRKTVRDFGVQWTHHPSNDGFYGSKELFADIVEPLLKVKEIQGANVAEIGSGSGRVALMLAEAGAANVTAIEPSDGYKFLVKAVNESKWSDKIVTHQKLGEDLNESNVYDLILSVGVLMHVPKPIPVLRAAYKALKPGGKVFIWIYSREGIETYLTFVKPLRAISSKLPHILLVPVIWLTYFGLVFYHFLCNFLPLPLKDYLTNVLWKLSPDKRRLVIYDQLNPTFVKYYSKNDLEGLLSQCGFCNIELHHRHGYSWSAVGVKPD